MNCTNIDNTNFNRQLLKLSIPIIIQNLLSAAVSSCDVVMLNYVGQSSISAVSLAANYSNVLFMVYYGVGTGASLLCAQYFGKKDLKAIHIIEGIALRFSLVISLLVALIAFTMPDKMMQIFTSDSSGSEPPICGSWESPICAGVLQKYICLSCAASDG